MIFLAIFIIKTLNDLLDLLKICLFVESMHFLLPIFVQTGHTVSDRQAKVWFSWQILTKFEFDLYQWGYFAKFHYGLGLGSSQFVRDNFCPNQTYWIWMTSQNMTIVWYSIDIFQAFLFFSSFLTSSKEFNLFLRNKNRENSKNDEKTYF